MFSLLFLLTDLYFLIPAVNTEIFNPFAQLVIPTGMLINEAKAEIETHPVTAEAKISRC